MTLHCTLREGGETPLSFIIRKWFVSLGPVRSRVCRTDGVLLLAYHFIIIFIISLLLVNVIITFYINLLQLFLLYFMFPFVRESVFRCLCTSVC